MMKLQQNIKAFIRPGEQQGYVAECLEISVVTRERLWMKWHTIYLRQFPYI
jgi:hypothetical protein